MIERSIAAATHGRYLMEPPASGGVAPVMFGFHGYGEGAEAQLDRMRAIPGADCWRLVAIQGLHRFYQRRDNQVVASWMTRQDRELAIADNLAYVEGVVDAATREIGREPARLVLTAFSQGVAMGFRAATATARRVDGVIAVGGDVPPEIDAASLARTQKALVCRGASDEWYTDTKFQHDVTRLRESGVTVHAVTFEGGHEWSEAVLKNAATFLRELEESG